MPIYNVVFTFALIPIIYCNKIETTLDLIKFYKKCK